MTRLKSLVFLLFIMGAGILLERAAVALWERSSKVDWEVIQKALVGNPKHRTLAAISATTETRAVVTPEPVPTVVPVQREETPTVVPTPDLPLRFKVPSTEPLITPAPAENVPTVTPGPATNAEGLTPGPAVSPEPVIRPIPAENAGTPVAESAAMPNAAEGSSTMSDARQNVGAVARESSEKQADDDQLRMVCVCRMKSLPAASIAKTLKEIFVESPQAFVGGPTLPQRILIVPETVSNSLLISGPKAKVEEAKRLAKEMDRPAAMVRLEVRITEIEPEKVKPPADAGVEKDKAAEESAKGDLQVVAAAEEGSPLVQAEVTTLDNQVASIKMGRQEPRVTGTSQTQFGKTNSFTMTNVGTQIDLTPRVSGDHRVVLSMKLSDSRSGSMEEGAVIADMKDGKPLRTPSTEQFTAETTVQLQDGEPVILGGMNRDGKSGKLRIITVTAHILGLEASKAELEKKDKS